MSRWLRLVPMLLLGFVIAALVWRLSNPEDTTVKSRMVGKLVPDLVLQSAVAGKPGWRLRSCNCGPVVINFFASWCAPCIEEAKMLTELKDQGVPIVGIAVRDRPQIAGDMRHLVRSRIAGGENPGQIRAWLIERYGEWISYRPPTAPVGWPLWGAPLILLLLGALLVRRRIRLRRA